MNGSAQQIDYAVHTPEGIFLVDLAAFTFDQRSYSVSTVQSQRLSRCAW